MRVKRYNNRFIAVLQFPVINRQVFRISGGEGVETNIIVLYLIWYKWLTTVLVPVLPTYLLAFSQHSINHLLIITGIRYRTIKFWYVFNPSTWNLHFMQFHFMWVDGHSLQPFLSSHNLSLLIPFQLFPLFLMSYKAGMVSRVSCSDEAENLECFVLCI
jgi:hypothetical protein